MDDKEMRELELRTIVPQLDQWPTEYMHQKALHAAGNEIREYVRDAFSQLDDVDGNDDLTPGMRVSPHALRGKEAAP
jgi:hypothetical protein